MKKRLAEKIRAPKAEAAPVAKESGDAMEQFQKLPVQKVTEAKPSDDHKADKPKEEQPVSNYKVDPVLNFLDQVNDLEKRERAEKEAQEKKD